MHNKQLFGDAVPKPSWGNFLKKVLLTKSRKEHKNARNNM